MWMYIVIDEFMTSSCDPKRAIASTDLISAEEYFPLQKVKEERK